MKVNRWKMFVLTGGAVALLQTGGCFLTDLINQVVGVVTG